MKKAIHVKEYQRSKHGRAKFGGKVSSHNKSGRVEFPTEKSILYRWLNSKGIDSYTSDKLAKEKSEEYGGLLTEVGALYAVAKEQGMPAGYGEEPMSQEEIKRVDKELKKEIAKPIDDSYVPDEQLLGGTGEDRVLFIDKDNKPHTVKGYVINILKNNPVRKNEVKYYSGEVMTRDPPHGIDREIWAKYFPIYGQVRDD